MKKYLFGVMIIVIVGIYAVFSSQSEGVAMPAPFVSPPSDTSSAGTGQYKDGIYTSPVEDAFYGNLQVTATIKDGAIADLQYPVFPNDPGYTTFVNTRALPLLKQEAIGAKSAKVNTVSGASDTSDAFKEALTAIFAEARG